MTLRLWIVRWLLKGTGHHVQRTGGRPKRVSLDVPLTVPPHVILNDFVLPPTSPQEP